MRIKISSCHIQYVKQNGVTITEVVSDTFMLKGNEFEDESIVWMRRWCALLGVALVPMG